MLKRTREKERVARESSDGRARGKQTRAQVAGRRGCPLSRQMCKRARAKSAGVLDRPAGSPACLQRATSIRRPPPTSDRYDDRPASDPEAANHRHQPHPHQAHEARVTSRCLHTSQYRALSGGVPTHQCRSRAPCSHELLHDLAFIACVCGMCDDGRRWQQQALLSERRYLTPSTVPSTKCNRDIV